MSGHALSGDEETSAVDQPATPDSSTRSRWISRILPLILFVIVVVGLATNYRAVIFAENRYIAIVFDVVLSVFLSLLPAMICVVQNTTRRRQLNRLIALKQFPVSGSTYFRTALTSVDMMRTG
jgi:hypothetical protein